MKSTTNLTGALSRASNSIPLEERTEGRHNFIDAIGGSVWDGDAETNACAHRFLTLLEQSEDAVAIFSLDFAEAGEQVD